MTQALVKLQAERLVGAHVFQAYTGLQTAERLRQVRGVGGVEGGGLGAVGRCLGNFETRVQASCVLGRMEA